MKRHVMVAVLAVGLLLMPIEALATSPRIIPASGSPHGHTYGEWGAAWWQWALSQPVASNPVLDDSGAACTNGQSGAVWFLAGTSGGDATRNCVVPPGKTLFFPIINSVVSTAHLPGADEATLRRAADTIIDDAFGLEVTIDRETVADLTAFRVQSPLFTFEVPTDNLLGADPGAYEGVDDGFYVMLPPLPAGNHTIEFEGALPTFGFSLDVTYHLTVGV